MPSTTSVTRARTLLRLTAAVAGAALLVAATLAWWVDRRLLDAEGWARTVAPLASDPAFLDALATDVTDAIVEATGLRERLTDALDDGPLGALLGDGLAVPIADQVVGALRLRVRAALDTETFRTLWVDVNRAGHPAVLAALTGRGDGSVRVEGDELSVDAAPIVRAVERRLVSDGVALAALLPDDLDVRVVVLRSPALPGLRTSIRLLERLVVALPLAAVACLAAVVAAAPRRGRGVVEAAVVAIGGLGVALLSIDRLASRALPATSGAGAIEAAAATLDALTTGLATALWAAVGAVAVTAMTALALARTRSDQDPSDDQTVRVLT